MSKNRQQNQTAKAAAPAPVETTNVKVESADVAATEVKDEAAVAAAAEPENVVPEAAPVVDTPAAAPVYEPTPQVTIAPLSTIAPIPSDEFELPLSVSPASRITIEELKDYVAKMSTRVRMSPAEGGQVQSMLYFILIQAINTRAEDFEAVFGMTMKIIRANLNGCFSDLSVHRYTPHVTLQSTQASQLRYLVNVLTALADPSPHTRQLAMRQVNVEQALSARAIKEESRQRVLAFFNIS